MFRYIDMPKLVAYYLREFSYRRDGTTSTLYQFVFSLCLPFVSKQFRSARLAALAIAECTNSADQIKRLFDKLMGGDAKLTILSHNNDFLLSWDGTGAEPLFPFDGSAATNDPQVPYSPSPDGNDPEYLRRREVREREADGRGLFAASDTVLHPNQY